MEIIAYYATEMIEANGIEIKRKKGEGNGKIIENKLRSGDEMDWRKGKHDRKTERKSQALKSTADANPENKTTL